MSSGTPNHPFNKKLKPCQRCKIQRRKCDRSSETADCYRCIKSNRDCISDDGTGNIGDESIDGNIELQRLTQNVASLQESLQRMEVYLHQERLAYANTTPERTVETYLNQLELSSPAACTQNSPYSVYIINHDTTSASLQLSTTMPPASKYVLNGTIGNNNSHDTTTTTSPMDQDEKYEWNLTFVDGKLRLESAICSFEELTAYGNALRQYLSPFAGVFNNTAFLFETMQPKSLVPMIIQVVAQGPYTRKKTRLLTSNANMWNKYHFLLKRHHPAVLLAAMGKPPPISCIDELVHHYFTCFNPGFPMIHAPSYFAEYETVVRPDPTQHAITMGFCCFICASTCRHLPYNNYERRILADYFYDRTVDLIGDFFDEPDRRLETLIVTNLLSHYFNITLRVADARKWCTIGYMIAKDLYQEYESAYPQTEKPLPTAPTTTTNVKEPSSPHSVASTSTASTSASASSHLSWSSSTSSSASSSFTASPSTPIPTAATPPHSTSIDYSYPFATTPDYIKIPNMPELTPTTTDRDFAIFRRHYIMSLCAQRMLNLIIDHDPGPWDMLSSRPVLYLEDECEMTQACIGVFNKALQLTTHPVVLELKEQTHRMQLGEKAKVTLELILRFDQVYKDWWSSLPPEFRLCDEDPADASCRPYIEKCPNQLQLMVFLLAVIHKAEANIALTKPSNQSSISEDADLGLVRAIQERALNDAYECVVSSIMAMKKLETNKMFCVFTSDLLLWVSDLLCTLSASPSASVKSRAQHKLMESLRELRSVRYMEGNLVPPALSPLAFMNTLATSSPLPTKSDDLSINIMEMYNEYTLPGLAFGYDILRMASESE